MKAVKIIESIEVKATQEKIFDFTQDYDRRLDWDTFLTEARMLNNEEPGVGASCWCVTKQGVGFETKYVSFRRPKATAVLQTNPSRMFRRFAGSWQFKEIGPQQTRVIFTYSFVLRPPFHLLNFVFRWVMSRNVQQRLKDLKKCIEYDQV